MCSKNSVKLSADVTSLYPHIPNNFSFQTVLAVLEKLQYFLLQHTIIFSKFGFQELQRYSISCTSPFRPM